MKLSERAEGEVRIFEFTGRMDVYTVSEVKTRILQALARGQAKLVLDLSGVEFIDSSGIGALVVCLKRAVENGGGLKMAGMSADVHSMFEITRTDRLFEHFPTAEEAVTAFAAK